MLRITWLAKPIEGSQDLLPIHWFSYASEAPSLYHDVIMPNGTRAPASCSVTVNGEEALIDYGGEHHSINEKNGIVTGVYRITFTDINRDAVKSIEWRESDGQFEKARVVWNFGDDLIDEIYTDSGSEEGNKYLKAHLRRERDSGLVKKKIDETLKNALPVRCEACGFDFEEIYGELGRNFCEVHHRVPLSLGPRESFTKDLAILCSNCHRMIHRTNPILDVKEFASTHLREGSRWRR